MKVENLKELELLVKMLNKHGVSHITIDGIEMRLDGQDKSKPEADNKNPQNQAQYTDEELALWSVNQVI